MDTDFLQNLRYKLQKRFPRVNSSNWEVYHWNVKQLWDFIVDAPALAGITDDLQQRGTQFHEQAKSVIDGQAWLAESELEAATIGLLVVRHCAQSGDDNPEIAMARHYRGGGMKASDSCELFTTYFVEPLYEYVDEQLDDQRAVLALLRRYKHKCEWFQRTWLYEAWNADTKRGEKTLALHLYEYLHDQGLNFIIEPASVSGEVDLIAAQHSDDPLLADAKIFNPEGGRGKDYIAKGVGQIYRYAVDYNEPVGYLVIYKTCAEELGLALTGQSGSTPFLTYNNKTIFLIVIDVFPYEEPASKRGVLKVVEITEADLIKVIPDGREVQSAGRESGS